MYGNFPLMLAAIAIVTFLLLARTFRSVVLAVKAVLVNLVSLGASFGFLVLFWQDGHGSNLIYGVPATGSIRNWIPIVAFAFLFGISMDYEVFILARMREEYDRTGSTTQAVVGSLAHTGRLVTCAALILAISFASLSTAPDIVVADDRHRPRIRRPDRRGDRPHPARPRPRRDHGPLELVDARRTRPPAAAPTRHSRPPGCRVRRHALRTHRCGCAHVVAPT